MKDNESSNILAIVTIDKNMVIHSDASTFLAENKESQEEIASELIWALGGNAYKLSNGVIIITKK